jgi:ribose 5-phosphate isomerase B
MRVYLGSDHAGYEFKKAIIAHLTKAGHEPIDCGAYSYDAEDDYPAFCIAAAERTVADPGSLGIVLGGSGNGEQIAANKVQGIRAALVWNESTAKLAREHNDANVVAVGARQHSQEEVLQTSYLPKMKGRNKDLDCMDYQKCSKKMCFYWLEG